jgi:hypothetical protein
VSRNIILDGVEWMRIIEIAERMVEVDDACRVKGRTIFRDRSIVGIAISELKNAKKSRRWRHYVKQSFDNGFTKVIIFIDNSPNFDMKISACEEYLESAPEFVRLNINEDILTGISWIMCKAKALGQILELTDYGKELADKVWKRCLLYDRRRIGGKKAAWKRKGYIVEYDEVPDYREPEFHEGAKLFYELNTAR